MKLLIDMRDPTFAPWKMTAACTACLCVDPNLNLNLNLNQVSRIPYAAQFNASHRTVRLEDWVASWPKHGGGRRATKNMDVLPDGKTRSSDANPSLQDLVNIPPEYLFTITANLENTSGTTDPNSVGTAEAGADADINADADADALQSMSESLFDEIQVLVKQVLGEVPGVAVSRIGSYCHQ